MNNGKRTFIKITNQDIYNEIRDLKSKVDNLREESHNMHLENKSRINQIRWVAGSALSLSVFLCANLIIKII